MLALSATHVAAAILGSALLLLTLADGAHGAFEAPESVHRRAFFQLDSKRLSQAMWLDGAVNHGVPSRFPCSSLEGAACLYSSPERSRFAEDPSTSLLGGNAGPADSSGAAKMKLVLLKPGDGQGIKELLKSLEKVEGSTGASGTAATRNQDEAQQLLEKSGGEVVFEGDPASISDVDSVAQAMLSAMGVPETGRVADSLKQQLAKMLTEAEFAPERAKKHTAAAATDDSLEGADSEASSSAPQVTGGSVSNSQGDSGHPRQRQQGSTEDTLPPDDLGTSISNLLNSVRAVQQHAGASGSSQPDATVRSEAEPLAEEHALQQPATETTQQQSASDRQAEPGLEPEPERGPESQPHPEPDSGPESEPGTHSQPEPERAAVDAPQQLHAGQPRRRAAGRGSSQRHSNAKQRAAPATKSMHDAANTAAAQDKLYVDDETGEQFVLSDEVLPEGEEKVYIDDRTGNTYVVSDDGGADSGSGERVGRLSRRLSDNQRWLDGLSDQEYDEYMDNYYDQLDREDAAREEQVGAEGGQM